MIKHILNILFYPVRLTNRIFHAIMTLSLLMIMTIIGKIVAGFKAVGRKIKAAFWGVCHSPKKSYQALIRWRNWLLAKIQYMNEESAKWKMTFNIIKSPYSFLRMMGVNPQMAIGLLFAGSVAGGGVIVNETVFADRSFNRGDAGIYSAPLDIPTSYVEGDNTLRIDLGSTPVREITIENVSVGTVFTGSALPSGEANVVQISGNPAASGFNATRLEIGLLIFENSRCKKLTLTDIQAHTIIVRGNASDG